MKQAKLLAVAAAVAWASSAHAYIGFRVDNAANSGSAAGVYVSFRGSAYISYGVMNPGGYVQGDLDSIDGPQEPVSIRIQAATGDTFYVSGMTSKWGPGYATIYTWTGTPPAAAPSVTNYTGSVSMTNNTGMVQSYVVRLNTNSADFNNPFAGTVISNFYLNPFEFRSVVATNAGPFRLSFMGSDEQSAISVPNTVVMTNAVTTVAVSGTGATANSPMSGYYPSNPPLSQVATTNPSVATAQGFNALLIQNQQNFGTLHTDLQRLNSNSAAIDYRPYLSTLTNQVAGLTVRDGSTNTGALPAVVLNTAGLSNAAVALRGPVPTVGSASPVVKLPLGALGEATGQTGLADVAFNWEESWVGPWVTKIRALLLVCCVVVYLLASFRVLGRVSGV